jgi:hypothetical protein
MSMTETRLWIRLRTACDHEECAEFADPLLEQLSSGKYDRMSVLEIPRTVDEWRAANRTARKRVNRAFGRGYRAVNLNRTGGEDWDAINQSAPVRQGRPMTAGYMNPSQFSRLPAYPCPLHATRVTGIHDKHGNLVAYLVMLRAGDLALVSQILGHDEHLSDEIMSLLFQHALERELHTPGLVVYNRHDSGGLGLRDWKEWHGFEERQVEWLP